MGHCAAPDVAARLRNPSENVMPTTKRPVAGKEPDVSDSAAASAPAPAVSPPPQPDEPANGTVGRSDGISGKSGSRWLGRLLRVAVFVALIVGVGAGVYYGWPIVNDRVIAPVRTNTSDVGVLRDRIAQLEAEVTALGATDVSVQADVAVLADRLAEHDRRLTALDQMDTTLASSNEIAARTAAGQIRLLKGMELMSRARLFLYQSNFGLAEQDLEAARSLLADIAVGDVVDGEATASVALDRLDRAIDALPAFPVAASDELDIAWQALLGRVPAQGGGDTKPTTELTAQPTPTSSPAP
jgi:hypothetical protein